MGQKANPTSLQLGTKKNWKTTFAEKKARDVGSLTQLLEIEIIEFVERFVNKQGFCLKDYRIQHCENNLKIFVYIFSTEHLFVKKPVIRGIEEKIKEDSAVLIKTKTTGNLLRVRDEICNHRTLSRTLIKLLIKGISDRLGGIKITFLANYVNTNLNLEHREKSIVKKSVLSLRRFKREFFFKESFNAAFLLTKDQNSADILLKILVHYFKITKRTKPFLKFLKKTLTLLVENPNNSLKGMKLKIKGRLTRSGRAKSFAIVVGDAPCHSNNIPVNYTFAGSQNQRGSYGIKIWVVSKIE